MKMRASTLPAARLAIAIVGLFLLCGCASLEQRISSHTVGETRVIFATSVAADALSTGAAINNGVELNPLYRNAGPHLTQRVALTGLLVPPICDGIVRLLWPRNDNAIKACYVGASGMRFAAATWNTGQVISNNKK